MSRTRIAVVTLAATIAVAGFGGVSNAQNQYTQGPLSAISGSFTVSLKAKAKVKKRTFRIGTATCASGTCSVLAKSARTKVRKKRGAASLNLNSLTGPATAPVTATISKRALKRLRSKTLPKKKRKGKLNVSLTVQGTGGTTASLNGSIALKGK